MAEPQGSNGIAISGKLTESGNAMLLINPHTSFYFRGEVHVVSEEGLNAYGAVTWGQMYQYGEELRPLEVSEISLKYKDGDSLKTKTYPAYHSHHGPITHMEDGHWTASAMMWEPVKALEQSFIRTKVFVK